MNKKQEWLKAILLLCLGIGIGTIAYSYRHQLIGTKSVSLNLFEESAYSYTPCEIYSSVPGQYYVRMKFLIPSKNRWHEKAITKNMIRIRDNIFVNVSSDTELGDHLKSMKWDKLKEILIEEINQKLPQPIRSIYLQECLIMKSR